MLREPNRESVRTESSGEGSTRCPAGPQWTDPHPRSEPAPSPATPRARSSRRAVGGRPGRGRIGRTGGVSRGWAAGRKKRQGGAGAGDGGHVAALHGGDQGEEEALRRLSAGGEELGEEGADRRSSAGERPARVRVRGARQLGPSRSTRALRSRAATASETVRWVTSSSSRRRRFAAAARGRRRGAAALGLGLGMGLGQAKPTASGGVAELHAQCLSCPLERRQELGVEILGRVAGEQLLVWMSAASGPPARSSP